MYKSFPSFVKFIPKYFVLFYYFSWAVKNIINNLSIFIKQLSQE